jgi:hypothetical protein
MRQPPSNCGRGGDVLVRDLEVQCIDVIPCMILTGNGCKPRPVRADRADVAVVSAFTSFMNSISP